MGLFAPALLTLMNNSPFVNSQAHPSPPGLFTTYRLPSILCLIFVAAFAIFFSALAIQQHHTFQTNGLDLGNVDQALWNTAQGRLLHFTLMTPVQSRLALHVEPILWLFVPFYWLNWAGPELLLIVQATVVAFGAWPVYQLSIVNCQLSMTNPQSPSPNLHPPNNLTLTLLLTFPLAYLLLPTLESAVLFDFHAVTFSPTFLLFAFLALEQRRNRAFMVFALLAMACKEDMPLVVAMLGLYSGLAQGRWRLAGLTIGLSGLWFVLAFFLIQPRFAAEGNIQLDRYAWLGETPLQMIQTLFSQPALVFDHLWRQADLPNYLSSLLFPTAFLALFSPLTLLPMLPTLAINLLSDNPFTWRLEDFHYGAPLAPFLFISTIYGIRRISEWIKQRIPQGHNVANGRSSFAYSLILLGLIFSLLYHYHRGFTPLAQAFSWPHITAHQQRLAEVLATIPPDTPLFTQSNLAPHLSQRPYLYTDFAYFTDPAYPAPLKAEAVLLDVTAFENKGGLHQFLHQHVLAGGVYRLALAEDGILHLQTQSADQPAPPNLPLPASFYTFTRPDSPAQYPLEVDFGDTLRLHGYSLHFNRQEEIQVTVDLEALKPLTTTLNIQPVLYLLDAEGQPQGASTDLQPALVWYPPAQWPAGQVVRIRFNTLPWYTRATPAYRLALGVINGKDVWQSPRYQPGLSQPTNLAVRLPAAGTLVELARIEQKWQIPQGGPLLRQFTLPSPTQSLEANFNNQIKLLSINNDQLPITNDQLPISQGHNVTNYNLTLTWQALTNPPMLTRFVQLIGPNGQIYGQNDSAPDRDQYPTHLWQPGEVVTEIVTLAIQPNRPPGPYTLHIGLYHPDTGARLPLISGGDHVEIGVNHLE
jgi:uncharacterized membrane protein